MHLSAAVYSDVEFGWIVASGTMREMGDWFLPSQSLERAPCSIPGMWWGSGCYAQGADPPPYKSKASVAGPVLFACLGTKFWALTLAFGHSGQQWQMWLLPQMGLLATELSCCCWVFCSSITSSLRAEVVFRNCGSDATQSWGFAVSKLGSRKVSKKEGPPQVAFQQVNGCLSVAPRVISRK